MENLHRKILTSIIAVILSVIGLEIGVRLLSGILGVSPYVMYDEVLGWTARPSATKIHKNAYNGFEVTYKINTNGFRGPLYGKERPDGVYRIMILGDSNGFGWGYQRMIISQLF